jgi:hypothetical protein
MRHDFLQFQTGRSTQESHAMRHASIRDLLLLAVLVFAGCSSNKGKIEGTKWTSERTTVNGKAARAGSYEVEFRSDGSVAYRVGNKAFTGTYSLGAFNTVTLNLDKTDGGRESNAEKIVINGDHMTMTDSGGTQVTFVKADASAKPEESKPEGARPPETKPAEPKANGAKPSTANPDDAKSK